MKIHLEEYNPEWMDQFESIKQDLLTHIHFLTPVIEHIGSTAVEGLSAKPIIDILVGVKSDHILDKVIQPLISNDYIYYDHEKYNSGMPYRRFFVKLKANDSTLWVPKIFTRDNDNELNDSKLAHIHVLPYRSQHWVRHIAFREYLRHHPRVKNNYQNLKKQLGTLDWKDGLDYNNAKNEFIKQVEKAAVEWSEKQQL